MTKASKDALAARPAAGSDANFRDRLKDRLLAVAEAAVARDGLDGLQARRIAEAADCAVGTLYNIFGDLHGLILATNARTLAELGKLLSTAARRASGSELETRLNTLAIAYLDFATANQRRWRAVFEHRLPDERPLPEENREDRRRLLALIEAELTHAIADAEARSDAAHALFSAVHGIVLLSLDGKLGEFEPAKCERQIRFLVGRVASGLDGAPGRV
jgi:AcrR family transcriptional regulator